MSVDVPRAPRLRDAPEYARRLDAVQQAMRARTKRLDGKLAAAIVLAVLGAVLLVLALVLVFAPASPLARVCLNLLANGA